MRVNAAVGISFHSLLVLPMKTYFIGWSSVKNIENHSRLT